MTKRKYEPTYTLANTVKSTNILDNRYQYRMIYSDKTDMNHDNNNLVKTPSNTTRPQLVPTISYAAPLAAITSNPEQNPHTYTEKEKTYLDRRSSSSSISTHRPQRDDLEHAISRVSTDPLGNTYPDGGREAYTVVFGSFCGCMLSLGKPTSL